MLSTREKHQRRAQRVRSRLRKLAIGKPRLSVSRSSKNISVQLIDNNKFERKRSQETTIW